MVFLRFPFVSSVKYVHFGEQTVYYSEIQNYISSYLGADDFMLHYNGKQMVKEQAIPQDATIHILFSLPGGKGGFGSMLRAIGAQIEKTTNREACRDLSGRRLRDINEEQRLKKWISKESEREAEKTRRRKERIERLKSKPKHNFVDFQYEKEISQLPERIDDALSAGLQKANKRPEATESCSAVPSKKKRLWLEEDFSDSSDSDSQACSSNENSSHNTNSLIRSEASSSESSDSSNMSASQSTTNENKQAHEINAVEKTEASVDETVEKMETEVSCKSASKILPKTEESTPQEIVVGKELPIMDSTKEQLLLNADTGASCHSTINSTEYINTEMDLSKKAGEISTSEKGDASEDAEMNEDVDLFAYESASDLESLGLERLKRALMIRGLKCGGNLTDRAERLWKVRGLQPSEFPTNLLAKNKK
ncbi:replication stress response regulator SDE2 [Caerostris extrusa]|uniref:Replication stress response regulator SDE2 n=1 Tax=Caerostris extrusa TaxID=172846 RepID=A0AAV4T2D2_CAEEX|nr:replication stress response regulator SDE2 [Caerostris extrusa]